MLPAKRLFTTRLNASWAALLLGLAVVLGVNRWAPQELPQEPQARLEALQAAQRPAEAEAVYQELLQADATEVELHYAYLQNHFKIPAAQLAGNTNQSLVDQYKSLTEDVATADLGWLGLGLLTVQEKEPQQALAYFERVQNRQLKYLNRAIGTAYQELGEIEKAEAYFQNEIAAQGDLPGAVQALAGLYLERNQVGQLQALAASPATAQFVSAGDQRRLALLQGDPLAYLHLAFGSTLRRVDLRAALAAAIIALAWLLYLQRANPFQARSLVVQLGVLLLGGAAALSSLLMSDGLGMLLPWQLGDGWRADLLYSLVNIGLVEELVKLAPVMLLVSLSRRRLETFDYVLFGTLSALGFATLENALYFTVNGLGILFARFLFSTVLHITATCLAAYFWAGRRHRHWVGQTAGWLGGLLLAAGLHGLFDFALIGPFKQLIVMTAVLVLLMLREYRRMLHNALSQSPDFDEAQVVARRGGLGDLWLSVGLSLLLIVYLYNNFTFSTAIANQQLGSLGLIALPVLTAYLYYLGRLRPVRGQTLPVWTSPR